jgi:hypothetical protein
VSLVHYSGKYTAHPKAVEFYRLVSEFEKMDIRGEDAEVKSRPKREVGTEGVKREGEAVKTDILKADTVKADTTEECRAGKAVEEQFQEGHECKSGAQNTLPTLEFIQQDFEAFTATSNMIKDILMDSPIPSTFPCTQPTCIAQFRNSFVSYAAQILKSTNKWGEDDLKRIASTRGPDYPGHCAYCCTIVWNSCAHCLAHLCAIHQRIHGKCHKRPHWIAKSKMTCTRPECITQFQSFSMDMDALRKLESCTVEDYFGLPFNQRGLAGRFDSDFIPFHCGEEGCHSISHGKTSFACERCEKFLCQDHYSENNRAGWHDCSAVSEFEKSAARLARKKRFNE